MEPLARDALVLYGEAHLLIGDVEASRGPVPRSVDTVAAAVGNTDPRSGQRGRAGVDCDRSRSLGGSSRPHRQRTFVHRGPADARLPHGGAGVRRRCPSCCALRRPRRGEPPPHLGDASPSFTDVRHPDLRRAGSIAPRQGVLGSRRTHGRPSPPPRDRRHPRPPARTRHFGRRRRDVPPGRHVEPAIRHFRGVSSLTAAELRLLPYLQTHSRSATSPSGCSCHATRSTRR